MYSQPMSVRIKRSLSKFEAGRNDATVKGSTSSSVVIGARYHK